MHRRLLARLDGMEPAQDLQRHQISAAHLWLECPLSASEGARANEERHQHISDDALHDLGENSGEVKAFVIAAVVFGFLFMQ